MKIRALFVSFLATIGAATLHAVPLSYAIGSGSTVVANSTDPGLVVQTSLAAGLSSTGFVLNDGQSVTFNFFDIWTNESAVNADDTVAKPISAFLDFNLPSPNSGTTVNGLTRGVNFLGIVHIGLLDWSAPLVVNAADRSFQISLSSEFYNPGLFGTGDGVATVEATITQLRSSVPSEPVPDASATLGLFGLSLFSLAALRRFLS